MLFWGWKFSSQQTQNVQSSSIAFLSQVQRYEKKTFFMLWFLTLDYLAPSFAPQSISSVLHYFILFLILPILFSSLSLSLSIFPLNLSDVSSNQSAIQVWRKERIFEVFPLMWERKRKGWMNPMMMNERVSGWMSMKMVKVTFIPFLSFFLCFSHFLSVSLSLSLIFSLFLSLPLKSYSFEPGNIPPQPHRLTFFLPLTCHSHLSINQSNDDEHGHFVMNDHGLDLWSKGSFHPLGNWFCLQLRFSEEAKEGGKPQIFREREKIFSNYDLFSSITIDYD